MGFVKKNQDLIIGISFLCLVTGGLALLFSPITECQNEEPKEVEFIIEPEGCLTVCRGHIIRLHSGCEQCMEPRIQMCSDWRELNRTIFIEPQLETTWDDRGF